MTTERKRQYMREYRAANPDKYREYRRREKERYASDPTIRSRRSADHKRQMGDPSFREKHRERVARFKRENPQSWMPIQVRSSAKKRAKSFGVPFDLDDHKDAFAERVRRLRCELSGIDLVFGGGAALKFNSLSVDRIRPEDGYTYANIRIVAWCLNAAFGSWGDEAVASVVRRWIDRMDLI